MKHFYGFTVIRVAGISHYTFSNGYIHNKTVQNSPPLGSFYLDNTGFKQSVSNRLFEEIKYVRSHSTTSLSRQFKNYSQTTEITSGQADAKIIN